MKAVVEGAVVEELNSNLVIPHSLVQLLVFGVLDS